MIKDRFRPGCKMNNRTYSVMVDFNITHISGIYNTYTLYIYTYISLVSKGPVSVQEPARGRVIHLDTLTLQTAVVHHFQRDTTFVLRLIELLLNPHRYNTLTHLPTHTHYMARIQNVNALFVNTHTHTRKHTRMHARTQSRRFERIHRFPKVRHNIIHRWFKILNVDLQSTSCQSSENDTTDKTAITKIL